MCYRLIHYFLQCAIPLCVCLFSLLVQAEESIEYVAEHLLETPMDTRALAYPATPADIHHNEFRLQTGYGSFDAGKLNNSVAMLGANYFFHVTDTWGLLAGAFYDHYQFSGENGKAVGEVLVVNAPQVPDKFAIDVTDVSGSGKYAGISLALSYAPGNTWRWQFGYAHAEMDIKKFKVAFNTTDLTENFSGSFDYASHYRIHTLFVGAEMAPQKFTDNFTYSPHIIIVRNSPRAGFQGRFTSPGFDESGDTDANGHGKHIPDNFMGAGVNLEHKPSGIRMDIGAMLYIYAMEPSGHKGISTPIFLTFSFPLF